MLTSDRWPFGAAQTLAPAGVNRGGKRLLVCHGGSGRRRTKQQVTSLGEIEIC